VFKDKLVRRGPSRSRPSTRPSPSPRARSTGWPSPSRRASHQDDAKKISKIIRDEGPKGVRAQVQGEELRVSAKKKDDLQQVISLLKGKEFDFALQFVNYR
jgi:uncharacterized protein YajQ (UPF0234 family)